MLGSVCYIREVLVSDPNLALLKVYKRIAIDDSKVGGNLPDVSSSLGNEFDRPSYVVTR